jgi:hypothetical protein
MATHDFTSEQQEQQKNILENKGLVNNNQNKNCDKKVYFQEIYHINNFCNLFYKRDKLISRHLVKLMIHSSKNNTIY